MRYLLSTKARVAGKVEKCGREERVFAGQCGETAGGEMAETRPCASMEGSSRGTEDSRLF